MNSLLIAVVRKIPKFSRKFLGEEGRQWGDGGDEIRPCGQYKMVAVLLTVSLTVGLSTRDCVTPCH